MYGTQYTGNIDFNRERVLKDTWVQSREQKCKPRWVHLTRLTAQAPSPVKMKADVIPNVNMKTARKIVILQQQQTNHQPGPAVVAFELPRHRCRRGQCGNREAVPRQHDFPGKQFMAPNFKISSRNVINNWTGLFEIYCLRHRSSPSHIQHEFQAEHGICTFSFTSNQPTKTTN